MDQAIANIIRSLQSLQIEINKLQQENLILKQQAPSSKATYVPNNMKCDVNQKIDTIRIDGKSVDVYENYIVVGNNTAQPDDNGDIMLPGARSKAYKFDMIKFYAKNYFFTEPAQFDGWYKDWASGVRDKYRYSPKL